MTEPIIQGTGEHTYEWIDNWATMPEGKHFGYTHGVCEVEDGRIFIHNAGEDAVSIFDSDGKFITSWGSEYASGAHGMQWSKEDGQEYLYLALTNQHVIAKTTRTTRLPPRHLGRYSKRGTRTRRRRPQKRPSPILHTRWRAQAIR